MGSFAKRLGQLAAVSMETESANILKTGQANKVPGSLALALDGTLRRGHDMKVFGLGTAASLADRGRYSRFTHAMHTVYSTMEHEMDAVTATAPSSPVGLVWTRHGQLLRREAALRADLDDVRDSLGHNGGGRVTDATARYVDSVLAAGEADRTHPDASARLLGHLYCRYFADLFGGQMLAKPTAVALSLPPSTPRHYFFDFGEADGRRGAIEAIYSSLNDAGALLDSPAQEAVVDEAMLAFAANIDVYSEERPLWPSAAKGAANVVVGMLKAQTR